MRKVSLQNTKLVATKVVEIVHNLEFYNFKVHSPFILIFLEQTWASQDGKQQAVTWIIISPDTEALFS